jgi:hypothetical protein
MRLATKVVRQRQAQEGAIDRSGDKARIAGSNRRTEKGTDRRRREHVPALFRLLGKKEYYRRGDSTIGTQRLLE